MNVNYHSKGKRQDGHAAQLFFCPFKYQPFSAVFLLISAKGSGLLSLRPLMFQCWA
jgi:hypothetical protein